ncbi:hypothetical protein QBC33DRAFT_462237 [Phialemonium atrogriseum]|uniref:Uncharacterized protein n=1 Tax=Phialemonium atrogriseum TaxID=1093897 RepID=A0AAJ0BU67_9PEZI|nr:uncharacterized protein QBC33DRAFT_462237 [Phialemonium atrogriseum]KAK1762096.1 hypothetical protein QBC33DRAFT_462237 [Phialemonium atrogriseum]
MDDTKAAGQAAGLRPPFNASNSLVLPAHIITPAVVRRGSQLIVPERDLDVFLATELRTPKLTRLHKYLWLAGLPVPARPLQRQVLMNRTLALTERPDEHLVWHRNRLFLKPLPDFLVCHSFWEQHLCRDTGLHRSACGLLLSYACLISYQADFGIAQKHSLLPDGLTYHAWAEFMKDFLSHINLPVTSYDQVDVRYYYGELRYSRLDLLSRLAAIITGSFKDFVYGFMSTSTWYQAFFEHNFGWLLGVFAFFTVILSALQVGLATDALQGSQAFQSFSEVVAIASLTTVLCGMVGAFVIWFVLFWYHLLSTIVFTKQALAEQSGRGERTAVITM